MADNIKDPRKAEQARIDAERQKKMSDLKKKTTERKAGKETAIAGQDAERRARKTIKMAATEDEGSEFRQSKKNAAVLTDGARLIGLCADANRRTELQMRSQRMQDNYKAADKFQSFATQQTQITHDQYAQFIAARDGSKAAQKYREQTIKDYRATYRNSEASDHDIIHGMFVDRNTEMKLRSYASMNIVESAARQNIDYKKADGTDLFTKAEKEILKTNDRIFEFRSGSDIAQAKAIFSKMQAEFGGKFKDVDATKLSEAQLKKMFGHAAGDTFEEQLCLAASRMGADAKKYNAIGKGKFYTAGDIVGRYTIDKFDDSEAISGFSSVSKWVKTADRYRLGLGGIVINTLKTGSFLAASAGKNTGKLTVYLFDKAGAHAMAGRIDGFFIRISQSKAAKAVSKNANTAKKAALEIWRKPITGTAKWTFKAGSVVTKTAGKGVVRVAKAADKVAWKFAQRKFGNKTYFTHVNTGVTKLKTGITDLKTKADTTAKNVSKAASKAKKKLKDNWFTRATHKIGNVLLAPANAFQFLSKWFLRIGLCVVGIYAIALALVLFLGVGSGGGDTAAVVVILDEEENFKDFQALYDEKQNAFLQTINAKMTGTSEKTDITGEHVTYGGTDEYDKGVKFTADGAITSNIEDILTVMAVMMSQCQASYHETAKGLFSILYDCSHFYQASESVIHPCAAGCHTVKFNCGEIVRPSDVEEEDFVPYANSDLHYLYKDQDLNGDGTIDETNDYIAEKMRDLYLFKPGAEDDFILPSSIEVYTCPVCGSSGCVEKADKCFHDDGVHCDNAEWVCDGHDDEWVPAETYTGMDGQPHTNPGHYESVDCPGEASCDNGHYECGGHACYECPGHEAKFCTGHYSVDIELHTRTFDELCTAGQGAIDQYRAEHPTKGGEDND